MHPEDPETQEKVQTNGAGSAESARAELPEPGDFSWILGM